MIYPHINRLIHSTLLFVLCLSVASAVFFIQPIQAFALEYTEDFDTLTVGDPFPSPWSPYWSFATTSEAFSAPNSMSTICYSGSCPNTFSMGSSTRGLLDFYARLDSDASNFSTLSVRLNNGTQLDSTIFSFFYGSLGSRVFRCGNNATEVEIGSVVAQKEEWYGMRYEWRTGLTGIEFRCGVQESGSGHVYSDWIQTDEVSQIDSASSFTLTPNNTSGWWYVDNFFLATDDDYDSIELFETRIESVLPVTRNASTTVATSTSMDTSVSGYVSAEDFEEGMKARLYAFRKSSTQQVSKVMVWDTIQEGAPHGYSFEWDITGEGDFTFSTTTDTSEFLTGEYTIVGELYYPVQNGFIENPWQVLMDALTKANGTEPAETNIRKVDQFIIGEATWYDELVHEVTASRDLALLDLNACNPLSLDFHIIDCAVLLIMPSESQLSQIWDEFYTGVFTRAPIGYVTRFVTIMSGGVPAMPPALTYTYGTSAPVDLQGRTMEFQIFDPENLTLINSIESDDLTDPKNIWEITMPFFNTIIALGILGVILHDIMRLGVPNGYGRNYTHGQNGQPMNDDDIKNLRINDYSDISQDEWNNLKSNKLI